MRRLALGSLVIAAAMASGATDATAQVCLGLPSFAPSSVHAHLAGDAPGSAKGMLLGLSAGRSGALFATLGWGFYTFDDIPENARVAFAEVGWQVALGPLELCPVAGGYLVWGPDDELARVTATSRGGTAGAALGMPVTLGPLDLVPNLSVKHDYQSQKVEEENVGAETFTYEVGVLDVGLALMLGGRVSVQPVAHVLLWGDTEGQEQTTWGVFMAVALGWPFG